MPSSTVPFIWKKSAFRKTLPGWVALCIALLLSLPVLAADEQNPEALAAALEQRLTSLQSLRFNFTQTTFSSGRQRQGSGHALFYRQPPASGEPVKQPIIRWNYDTPDQQVIINNGTTLSFYTARDHQMLVSPAGSGEEDITYGLLTGSRTLKRDFQATGATPRYHFGPENNLQSLRLLPIAEQGQVKEIHVWLDNDHLIRRLLIEDHFDTLTELNFDGIEPNGLQEKTAQEIQEIFTFVPPPGTEIIEQ